MPRIAIVGAGIAGLNAALALQDAGLPSSVYEASDRIGGRMHSDALTWGDGTVSEWCGEFIDHDHDALHQLIKRFGLGTIDLGWGRAGRAQTALYFFNRFHSTDELAGDFQALAPLLEQQLHEVGFPTTYNRFTEAGLKLDQLSAYDWIAQYVEGGHTTLLGRYLNAGCTGFYGSGTTEQSPPNPIYQFSSRDLSRGATVPKPQRGTSKTPRGHEEITPADVRNL